MALENKTHNIKQEEILSILSASRTLYENSLIAFYNIESDYFVEDFIKSATEMIGRFAKVAAIAKKLEEKPADGLEEQFDVKEVSYAGKNYTFYFPKV